MGDNVTNTFVLFLGISLIVAVVILGFRKKLWATAITSIALLLVMIIQRELVRQAYLENIFSPSDMTVKSQISPLIVFLFVLAVGIYAIYYMIRISLKPKTE